MFLDVVILPTKQKETTSCFINRIITIENTLSSYAPVSTLLIICFRNINLSYTACPICSYGLLMPTVPFRVPKQPTVPLYGRTHLS